MDIQLLPHFSTWLYVIPKFYYTSFMQRNRCMIYDRAMILGGFFNYFNGFIIVVRGEKSHEWWLLNYYSLYFYYLRNETFRTTELNYWCIYGLFKILISAYSVICSKKMTSNYFESIVWLKQERNLKLITFY